MVQSLKGNISFSKCCPFLLASTLKPILHYVLDLRFGNLERSKTAKKTQPAHVFFPMHSVIKKNVLSFFSRF